MLPTHANVCVRVFEPGRSTFVIICVCVRGLCVRVCARGSDGATGTFYEGVMTHGTASNATDDAVQANIVAAGYGK